MKKRSVLLTALATIAICVSLICGTTYALFTSESSVDVAITSGKVNVTATIDKDSVQTKDLGSEYSKGLYHTLSKDIVITDDSVLLNNLACGDGIRFNIVVTNESTIAVKYRTIVSAINDNGLFNGLTVEVGEGVVYDGNTIYSTWKAMEVQSEVITITIELPDLGNEYQGKGCSFSFSVEAVQGNAITTDGLVHIGEGEERKEFMTLQSAVDAAEANDTIFVDEDMNVLGQIYISKGSNTPITIDGNNHKVTIQNESHCIYAKSPVEFKNINLVCNSTKESGLTLDGAYMYELTNVEVTGKARHSLIRFFNSSGGIMTNCTVENTIAAEDTFYYNYGMDQATDIFVNRNTRLSGETEEGGVYLELTNCLLNTLIVNGSSTQYNQPKVYVKTGTKINYVFYASAETNMSDLIVFDGGEAEKVYAPYQYSKNIGFFRDMKYTDEVVYVVTNANGLVFFSTQVNNGQLNNATVYLDSDIDLDGINWSPIGTETNRFIGTFDGRGHIISNLTVMAALGEDGGKGVGLFGYITSPAVVKNFTIENANLTGYMYVAAVAGNMYTATIDNVSIKNVTITANRQSGGITGYSYGTIKNCSAEGIVITAIPNESDGELDNGDKIGGIVGYAPATYILNNQVKDVTLIAWRDLGGIAGYCQADGKSLIDGNSVEGGNLSYYLVEGYTSVGGHVNENMGAIVGVKGSNVNYNEDTNTSTNVTLNNN